MLLNYYTIIIIVAYYINYNGVHQIKLFKLQQLKREYSGINIARTVLNIISKYKISGYFRYFVLNNMLSNNIAVNLILKTFYP